MDVVMNETRPIDNVGVRSRFVNFGYVTLLHAQFGDFPFSLLRHRSPYCSNDASFGWPHSRNVRGIGPGSRARENRPSKASFIIKIIRYVPIRVYHVNSGEKMYDSLATREMRDSHYVPFYLFKKRNFRVAN